MISAQLKWHKKLTTYFVVMILSDTEALTALPMFLEDAALHSFESFSPSPKTDLTTALHSLRQSYGASTRGNMLFSQLFNTRQLPIKIHLNMPITSSKPQQLANKR
jgi:hypothetical protein